MSKFNKCLLKDIAVSQTGPFGSQLHEEDYVQNGTPIVTVEHLGEIGFYLHNLPMVSDKDKARLSKYTLNEGDIVFSRVGSIDKCTYVSKKEEGWLFSGRCLRVRINEKADAKFISYYFRQKHFKSMMLNISVGATMPSLNTTLMDNIPLYLPSKDEQQKIASVLSALDAKIELNQRINAELEAMAKTIYDYWFVQFDFPDEHGKPYKSSGGKMVWSEALKREVPAGWEVKELGEALKTSLGGTPSTHNKVFWENASIPWLNSGDIANFPVIRPSSHISQQGVDNSAATLLPKGSVVISVVRYIRPSIIAFDACTNQSVVGIRESEELKNAFIYPFLVNEVPRLMQLRTGAQQPHINKEIVDATNVCIPEKNVLKKYYKLNEPIYKQIINLAFESQTFTELRDWLLPMLMNGQVTVKTQDDIGNPNAS